MDSERWLLKVSSASDSKRPKHQQDSSPCQAKNTQTECFTSPLEPIINKASVPKQPNASMSRAHAKQKTRRKNASRDFWSPKKNNALVRLHNTRTPARSKEHVERTPHVTFGTQKKQCFGPVPKHPNAKHKQKRGLLMMASQRLVSLRSEKTETPAGSRPEEGEFLYQKGCQERGFRTMATQILVSLRSEKTETPARFEPMPSKKHAERMPHVTFGTYKKPLRNCSLKNPETLLLEPTKNKEIVPKPCETARQTFA